MIMRGPYIVVEISNGWLVSKRLGDMKTDATFYQRESSAEHAADDLNKQHDAHILTMKHGGRFDVT